MMKPYELRGLTAQPGARFDAWLPMFEFADGSSLDIPVIIIHGNQPGKTVFVGAGYHGDEINTVLALLDALQVVNPAHVHGTIVAVPVQNPYGYRHRRRLFDMNQSDSETLNLHRILPGNESGDPHERMAHFLYTLTKESGASFIFDLHTGTTGSYCPPHTFVPPEHLGSAAEEALAAAAVFNAGLIVQASEGVYAHQGMPHTVLAREGYPVLGAELGQGGYVDERYVSVGKNGILNVLRHLQVLQDGVKATRIPQPVLDKVIYARTNRGGLVTLLLKSGAAVEANQPIAEISNLYGETVEVIKAPAQGYVITTVAVPAVHQGERICRVGVPKT